MEVPACVFLAESVNWATWLGLLPTPLEVWLQAVISKLRTSNQSFFPAGCIIDSLLIA